MSGASVTTGVAYTNNRTDCDEPVDVCVYFDVASVNQCSAVFSVTDPWQVVAYDLPAGDEVFLQQVSGDNEGQYFEDVIVNGRTFKLDADNNRMMIPFAGRFRLRYEGTLGTATVLCEPSNCCIGPMFPAEAAVTTAPTPTVQVTNAFGVGLFFGDPINV